MANELSITVSAQENASTVIAGVGTTTQRTERVIVQSMGSTEEAFDTAARASGKFGAVMDRTAGAVGTASDGMQGVADITQGVSDVMSQAARKAEALAQAQQDVAQAAMDADQALQDLDQANRDLAQSQIDSEQAAVDAAQALLDQKVAQEEYNKAVKEFGAESNEAKQLAIDLNQAKVDSKQADEDAKQAAEDFSQAQLDAEQAVLNHSQAQKDLISSQRELGEQGKTLNKVSEWAGLLSGILGGLVGVIGAITAVQWAWNAALLANPIGLTIAAIVILIGIIVLIATKTTWFQDLWDFIWKHIGDTVKDVGEFIKTAFKNSVDFVVNYFKFIFGLPGKMISFFAGVGEAVSAPFKWGFNQIAKFWNNTVGKLSFSLPSWVPGMGGMGFSMPKLPTLQTGGEILRTGAVFAHKGERILPASTRGLTRDMAGQVLKVVVEFVGGHDSFRQFMKENVKIYGAGSVTVAYDN